jgi:hypothetical protein
VTPKILDFSPRVSLEGSSPASLTNKSPRHSLEGSPIGSGLFSSSRNISMRSSASPRVSLEGSPIGTALFTKSPRHSLEGSPIGSGLFSKSRNISRRSSATTATPSSAAGSPNSSACATRCNSGALLRFSSADMSDAIVSQGSYHSLYHVYGPPQHSRYVLRALSTIQSVDVSVAQASCKVQLQDSKEAAGDASAVTQLAEQPMAPVTPPAATAAARKQQAGTAARAKAFANVRKAAAPAAHATAAAAAASKPNAAASIKASGAASIKAPASVRKVYRAGAAAQGVAAAKPALIKKEKQIVGVHFTVQLGQRVPILPSKASNNVQSKKLQQSAVAAANKGVPTYKRTASKAAAAAAMAPAKKAAAVGASAAAGRPLLVRAAKQAAAAKCKLAFGSRVSSSRK